MYCKQCPSKGSTDNVQIENFLWARGLGTADNVNPRVLQTMSKLNFVCVCVCVCVCEGTVDMSIQGICRQCPSKGSTDHVQVENLLWAGHGTSDNLRVPWTKSGQGFCRQCLAKGSVDNVKVGNFLLAEGYCRQCPSKCSMDNV